MLQHPVPTSEDPEHMWLNNSFHTNWTSNCGGLEACNPFHANWTPIVEEQRLAIPFAPIGLPIAKDGRLAIPFTPQTVNNIFGIAQLSCAGDTLVHA